MYKKFAALLCGFLLTLQIFAQKESSLLWEVSGMGLSNKSYIFGTMHMMKKGDFFIIDLIKQKLLESKLFVTEIDMNISLLQQLEIAKKMYLPDDKTLQDYVSREEYQAVKNIVIDSMHVKKSKFEKYIRLKPFFLSALLSKHLVGKVKAYETELYKIAKNKGIPSDGLESFEFQFSLVEATPIDEQAKTLVAEVKDYKKTQEAFDQMITAYKQQDLDKLYEYVLKDPDSDAEFSENFIYNRNQQWIPLIEDKIKSTGCFIAVGAAHLPGVKGILHLL